MTGLIANPRALVERRRAFLQEVRQIESALETANALDRVAVRIRNPRVGEVLHQRAEIRRQMAKWARDHLGGRVPCPDPALGIAVRISQS